MNEIRDGEPPGQNDQGHSDGQAAFLGLEAAAPLVPAAAATPYRVLARKYRPQTFADLIGQEAMVQTVRNAFATNRIPQAWMLTGVRGVGKTTTARILARALNYDTGEPGSGPSIDMPDLGIHCRAIMESRHVDVLEMDAASHTGVENIRQITDAVRYAPVQARYKVYVIDEVHMLSTAAFNAFLKTLEEPPPHAKFVFATTEIRKVPVTILSRCQRFDLRRVESGTLIAHLDRICREEGVEVESAALAAIARAAEGSVRDALSLLDQAVAHGAGAVTEIGVRDMLGLADRGQVIDLFEAAMKGDVPGAFAVLRAGYNAGADPRQMMEDLATFTHLVTRIKLVPDAADDPSLTEAERLRGRDFAARLPVRALSRAWQILLKAVPEVGAAQRPLATAEMALVRLAYAADLPSPDEVLRSLRGEVAGAASGGGGGAGRAQPGGVSGSLAMARAEPIAMQPVPRADGAPRLEAVPRTEAAPLPQPPAAAPVETVVLRRFEDVVALAGEHRDVMLKTALERDVRLVGFEEGRIEVALEPTARPGLTTDLSKALKAWTGRVWFVSVSREASAPTIAEERARRESERRQDATNHPLVQAVLSSFPGAKIVDVRERVPEPDAVPDEPPPVDRTGEAGADEDDEF